MKFQVAVVGAGRMGSIVANQLPNDVDKLVIDTNLEKAQEVAKDCDGHASAELSDAKDADIIALVLPKPAIAPVGRLAAQVAKPGAIVLTMATKGSVEKEVVEANPGVHFIDARIIGHANSMKLGAPCFVVVKTEDQGLFEKIQHILPGYKKVVMGDSDVVPLINTVGSGEGIRAAVQCRKLLKQYNIPKEWEDIVIYTVCAGTMRSYVEGDLGEFARALADKLENEN